MLDFFTIFTKGGIVLWCFQGTSELFAPSVNSLVKSVILQVTDCFLFDKNKLNFSLLKKECGTSTINNVFNTN